MSSTRVTRSALKPSSATSEIKVPAAITKTSKPRSKRGSKAEGSAITNGSAVKHAMEPPATPPPKKAKKAAVIPSTPTPAAVKLMSGLHSPGNIGDANPSKSLEDRPADPLVTNAPLKTPRGSRVVTYSKEVIDMSPSKTNLPRPTTTTEHLLEDACAHLLKVDPGLKAVVHQHHCKTFSPEGLAEEVDPFRSLVSSILAQQVSGAAASSIKKKFIALFNDEPSEGEEKEAKFPAPAQVAAADLALLRTAGLSGRKAEYVKGLAEKFASRELSAKMLIDASYEELLEKLTAVRGLGKWSVEMFACFALKRMDVFSTGDLGVQ